MPGAGSALHLHWHGGLETRAPQGDTVCISGPQGSAGLGVDGRVHGLIRGFYMHYTDEYFANVGLIKYIKILLPFC